MAYDPRKDIGPDGRRRCESLNLDEKICVNCSEEKCVRGTKAKIHDLERQQSACVEELNDPKNKNIRWALEGKYQSLDRQIKDLIRILMT